MKQLLGEQSRVGFVTRIGEDRLSSEFAAELAADGLDTSVISRDQDRRMGLYLIELDGVERSFHYWRENSAARRLADDLNMLTGAVRNAGLIHLSGITLAILQPRARDNLYQALANARKAGSIVSFDPNIRPRLWTSEHELRAVISETLTLSDIALPSFDDETAHWGDPSPQATIQRCMKSGAREVIVKNGAGKVFFYADGQDGVCETAFVSEVRDTTGAGDAFNACYPSDQDRSQAREDSWRSGRHTADRAWRGATSSSRPLARRLARRARLFPPVPQ